MKLFKKKPKKETDSAMIQSELTDNNNFNNNQDASFMSYQSNQNMSFTMNPATPLDSGHSDPDNSNLAQMIPLNQNFSSIFNVPKMNKNKVLLIITSK